MTMFVISLKVERKLIDLYLPTTYINDMKYGDKYSITHNMHTDYQQLPQLLINSVRQMFCI